MTVFKIILINKQQSTWVEEMSTSSRSQVRVCCGNAGYKPLVVTNFADAFPGHHVLTPFSRKEKRGPWERGWPNSFPEPSLQKKTFECRGPHNAGIKLAGNFAGSLLWETSCQASLERENDDDHVMATNESALCRSASLAFSFVFSPSLPLYWFRLLKEMLN